MATSTKQISKASVERLGGDLKEIYSNNKMIVFLCGPTLKAKKKSPGSRLVTLTFARLRLNTSGKQRTWLSTLQNTGHPMSGNTM